MLPLYLYARVHLLLSANGTRDLGCGKHPVFPAPSEQGESDASLGRFPPRECGAIPSEMKCSGVEYKMRSRLGDISRWFAHPSNQAVDDNPYLRRQCLRPRPKQIDRHLAAGHPVQHGHEIAVPDVILNHP